MNDRTAFLKRIEDLVTDGEAEHERAQTELREIDLLIRQSTNEVERLSQRNSQIHNKVATMEADLDSFARSEIRSLYSAERDSQMRLFMMRSRVEQLQSKQQQLEKYTQLLQRHQELSSFMPSYEALEGEPGPRPSYASSAPSMGRVIEAQEEERLALARQIHDGPAQSLTNLIMQAEICERLFDTDQKRARQELVNLKNSASSTFQKVRDFIFELRPMMLDDLGLAPTLRRYCSGFEEKSGIEIHVQLSGKEQRLVKQAEITLFRCAQELLNNAVNHAHATQVQVLLEMQGDITRLVVEDNGSGFDVNEAMAVSRDKPSLGLSAMRERVEVLGGDIMFDSAVGRGTRVSISIPVAEASGRALLTA